MSYVPTVPGVPPPMSYGQGYGNWQQYAGFDRTSNPYGGGEGLGVQPSDKSAAATTVPEMPKIDAEVPQTDYSITSAIPPGQFGANPNSSLGMKPTHSFGVVQQPQQDPYGVINSHYGVQQ